MADKMELYVFEISEPSRAVMFLLDENEIPYEKKILNFGDSRKPEYLAVNPAGQAPCLVHGDLTLAEGAAILVYIAQTHGLKAWYPEDLAGQAKVNIWLHWVHQNIRASTLDVVFKMAAKAKPDYTRVKLALEFMEARLAESGPFLAGTKAPTVADLLILPECDQLEVLNFDYSPYPKVSAWLEAMKKALAKSHASSIGIVKTQFGMLFG